MAITRAVACDTYVDHYLPALSVLLPIVIFIGGQMASIKVCGQRVFHLELYGALNMARVC